MAETSLNYAELQVVLAKAANIANNRPIGVRSLTEEDIQAITPNMLLLGRTSTITNMNVKDDDEESQQVLPGWLSYLEQLLSAWWSQWSKQVFPNLVPYQRYKDAKRHRNICVGDVCLLCYDGKIKDTYRICRVVETKKDDQGVVRTVKVQLRPQDVREKLLPYKSKTPCIQETGVQRLVLIVPAKELQNDLARHKDDDLDLDLEAIEKPDMYSAADTKT